MSTVLNHCGKGWLYIALLNWPKSKYLLKPAYKNIIMMRVAIAFRQKCFFHHLLN